jgi:hypothetical protein
MSMSSSTCSALSTASLSAASACTRRQRPSTLASFSASISGMSLSARSAWVGVRHSVALAAWSCVEDDQLCIPDQPPPSKRDPTWALLDFSVQPAGRLRLHVHGNS